MIAFGVGAAEIKVNGQTGGRTNGQTNISHDDYISPDFFSGG